MIRVLIIDDHQLVREGYRALLGREKDMQVVGEGRDGLAAVELADQLVPDVVLMDYKMPRLNGFDATERLRTNHSEIRVLVVAMSWEEPLVKEALEKGAQGYVPKDASFDELVSAIRAVHSGKTYLSPRISSR
jgi:DNA-binding NarL/FixJ family response regulator